MSEFKTNKISPRKGTTTTIGDSGDSVSTSGGSTINNAGTITTAGITGGTINNTTGQIYLRGEVDWKPGDIKTASFTATDNQGFFVNTTSGQITVTLPASPSAGDVVGIKDYANTFDTNKCILNPNGNKIQGSTTNFEITVEGSSIIIIYVDSTKGWVITDASKAADISQAALFTVATGGTITESGDFKIHTFTGPGTFTVTQLGNGPTVPTGGPNTVSYNVVAGGGGGGGHAGSNGGGGGAGGFREGRDITPSYTASPLVAPAGLTVTATAFPITVGGGGTSCFNSTSGSPAVFSTITSTGGGGGSSGYSHASAFAKTGGSGGGGSSGPCTSGAAGNTPPVSPPQGQPGGNGQGGCGYAGAGGGGAVAAGAQGGPNSYGSAGGNGGNGTATSITGSPVTKGGGGGGFSYAGTAGSGGSGGGGNGARSANSPAPTDTAATDGTANTGGGGGGRAIGNAGCGGGNGGSGIVIIRYKFQ
jgi:hypothetical protein